MALSAGDQLLDDHLSGQVATGQQQRAVFHCRAALSREGWPITWGFQLSVFHSAAPHRWRPVLGVDKQSAGQLQVSLNYTATKVTTGHLCCFPVI